MKKITAAILTFDLVMGLLLFCVYSSKRVDSLQEQAGNDRQVASSEVIQTTPITVQEVVDCQESDNKKIALTFDDGPHPYYTEQLLDGLKERGVQATFFVTGDHAILHPDVIKRIHDEGHLIGNHTYSHMQLTGNNKEEFKEELVATSEVIEEITGEEVIYVRPPYGTWDKAFEEELNMIPVLWTVDSLDWCSQNVSTITQNVMKEAEENDIILMHDYYDTTVTAALKVIDELQAEGYTFVTVEEILFD